MSEKTDCTQSSSSLLAKGTALSNACAVPASEYVSPGMPELHASDSKALSFFEFWPTWLMYFPVVVQWLVLSLWYRSLTLPLLANPRLPISGMVGVPKSELFLQAKGECAEKILTWFLHRVTEESPNRQAEKIVVQMSEYYLSFPVVCKPDIGCRGSGVKLVNNFQELSGCLECYSKDSGVLVQRLASWEPEAGIFYVREPKHERGEIISLALKYMPYVVGDGYSTLAKLIENDPRASQLRHLYWQRHQKNWSEIIPSGEPFRLVFSASHCKGAIFRDGNNLITPALSKKLNQLMAGIPDFYYGRLDIKFSSVEKLQLGEDIEIVEINAASSESLHIWDKNTSFRLAISALLKQYRLLFKFGAQNRRRGFVAPSLKELIRRWRHERELNRYYPETD